MAQTPKSFNLSMTAQQIQEALLSVDGKFDKSKILTDIVAGTASNSNVPSTLAVLNKFNAVDQRFDGLGNLADKDSVALGSGEVTGTLPINRGGTGGATAEAARAALGVPSTADVQQLISDSVPEIQEVELGDNSVKGVLPVSKGGTGAETQSQARNNLGVYSQSETISQIASKICAADGYIFKGFFSTGFEITDYKHIGIAESGVFYQYVGSTLPKTVTAATLPSTDPDFVAWQPARDAYLIATAKAETQGFRLKGRFQTGFTIESILECGLAADGGIWKYVGDVANLPLVVPAGAAIDNALFDELFFGEGGGTGAGTVVVETEAEIPTSNLVNGRRCYVIATGEEFIYVVEGGESSGQWIQIAGSGGGGTSAKIVALSANGWPDPALYPNGTELLFSDTLDEFTLIDGMWVEDGNVGDETPIGGVLKTYANVDSLLAGTPLRSLIGDIVTTGRSKWSHVSGDGTQISHYEPIGRTAMDDFTGTSSQRLAQALAVNKAVSVGYGSHVFDTAVQVAQDVDIVFDSLASCELSGTNEVLEPVNGCNSIKVSGGYFFANTYHTNRPQVVRNSVGVIGVTDPEDYPSTFTITNVRTMNVGLGDVHVNTLNKTIVHAVAKNNQVESDDNTDAYVSASGAGSVSPWYNVVGFDGVRVDVDIDKVPGAQFTNNSINVFHESGSNKDVIKLSGTLRDYHVNDNPQIKNRNNASAAEIDTFTAGRGLQFNNNTLVNVAVKVQTHSGSLAPNVGDAWYMSVCDNNITIESENANQWSLLIKTAFGNVNSNNLLFFGQTRAAGKGDFSGLLVTNLDNTENGFGTNNPAALTLTGNVSTVIFGDIESFTGNIRTANIAALQGSAVTGNVFSGGTDLLIPASAVRDSNAWVGNNIYSEHFTAEGVMRLTQSIIGAGNRIARSPLNTDNLMVEAALTVVAGQHIEFTIPESLVTPQGTVRPCFLHIAVLGGIRNNVQSFLFGRCNPDDAEPYIEAFSSRIDPATSTLSYQRAIFSLGFESGALKLRNKYPANGDSNDPTTIRYTIEPIGTGIYGAFV